MKNILFILPWLPYPLKSGGHQAIFNGIKAVVDDYNVFITYDKNEEDDDSEECAELLKLFGNRIKILPFKKTFEKKRQSIVINSYIKFWNFIKQLKQKLGLSKKIYNPSFFKINIIDNKRIIFLNDLIVKFNIDVVQCEMLNCISDILILPSSVKKIYVQHQIDYIYNKLNLQEKNLTNDFKNEYESGKQNEIFLLNRYDAVIALSEYDKNIMEKDGVLAPIYVSPAIISTELRPYKICKKTKILSFVGPSSHSPNKNGIEWFLKNCWAELKKMDAAYKLQIIGEWDYTSIKSIQKTYQDVQFCGFIPDLAKKIENTIMIVPIKIGSGIRMKILEAISLGVPVVSTSIGAQGLPLEDSIDCFITDNPQKFIENILKLKDETVHKTLVQNAQNKIKQNYSIQSFRNERINIYERTFSS